MLNRRVLSLSASIVGRNYLKPSSYDVRKCTYLHKPFITLRPSSIFASFSSDSDSFFPEELTKEHDDHSTSNRVNAGTSTSASTGAVPVDTVGKRSKTTFANELTFNAERRNLNVLELLVYEDGFLHMNEFGQVNPILARIKIQSRHPREGVSKFIALEKWHNPGVRRTYDSTQLIVDHDLHKFQDLRKLLGHTLPELYANLSLHERRQLFSRVEVKATQEKHVPVKGKGVEMKELNLTETQSTRFADYLHRLDRPSSVLEPEMESPSCSFMHYIHDLPSVEQCDLSEADVLSDENPDKDILRKIDYRVDRINGPDRRDEGLLRTWSDFWVYADAMNDGKTSDIADFMAQKGDDAGSVIQMIPAKKFFDVNNFIKSETQRIGASADNAPEEIMELLRRELTDPRSNMLALHIGEGFYLTLFLAPHCVFSSGQGGYFDYSQSRYNELEEKFYRERVNCGAQEFDTHPFLDSLPDSEDAMDDDIMQEYGEKYGELGAETEQEEAFERALRETDPNNTKGDMWNEGWWELGSETLPAEMQMGMVTRLSKMGVGVPWIMSFERMQKCYDMMFHYRSGIAKQNGKWKKMKQRLKLREEQIDHMRVQHKRKETLRDFIDKFEKRKRARLANVVTDFRKKQDERRRKKGVENENDCEGTGNDDEKDNAKSASLQIPTKQIPYLNTITGLTPNIGSGKFDAQSIKHLRARDMELDTDGNDILQERLRRHRLSSLDAYVKAKTFEDRKEKDLKYRKLGGRDTQTTSSLASSNSRSSVSRSQYQPPQAYLRHMKPSTMRMSRYKKNERDHGHKEEYLQEKEKEGARMKSRKDRRATSSSYFSDDTFSSEKGRPVERFRPGSKMTNQRRSLKLSESPESPPALTPASSSPTYKERSRSRRSRGGTRHGSLDGTPAVTTEEKHSVVQSLFRDSSTSRNKRRK